MPAPNLFVLVALDGALAVGLLWLLLRRTTFSTRVIVWSSVWFWFTRVAYIAWVATHLFLLWNANPDCPSCQVHLPPYSNFWYEESFGRWGAYFGVNIAAGLVFGLAFWFFAKRTGGRVIDRDDVFLLTLVGMMTGWPNILLFLIALFVSGAIISTIKRLAGVPEWRVVVTPVIPIAALPIIIFGDVIAHWAFNLYDIGLVAIRLTPPTLPSL
ncbi:MAG: hypothetical protein HYZ09_01930 [Candidatus Kerfeldbacteria bacterium]|nr:hypothetical protein [Candidatus Kerfeldbacteria bacterium]